MDNKLADRKGYEFVKKFVAKDEKEEESAPDGFKSKQVLNAVDFIFMRTK